MHCTRPFGSHHHGQRETGMRSLKSTHAAGALALLLVAAPLAAQGRGHGSDKKHDEHGRARPSAPQHAQPQRSHDQRRDEHKQAIVEKQVHHQRTVQQRQASRVSEQELRSRIAAQQQRDRSYQQYLAQRTNAMQRQSLQLQQQKRLAQYRYQQQYLANLRAQQAQLSRVRNYNTDPYYNAPYTYRYTRSGAQYQTNQYGADALKRAVNNGYEQGVRAGQADRQDGWAYNYQNSYAYQDANYGYDGRYVSQNDYNYYFRQGFQRGYEDGYRSARQYGSYTNSSASILGSLASSILGLQLIR